MPRRDRWTRREILGRATLGLAGWATWTGAGCHWLLVSQCPGAVVEPRVEGDVAWYDVAEWGVEGRGWSDQPRERYFDRLPAKAKQTVRPPVWSLSRHSAGMCAHFTTDSTTIRVRYKLMSSNLGMPHMPPTGVSGVDLYATDDQSAWRWANVVKPNSQTVDATLLAGAAPGRRRYAMYLPLYNGVDTLQIGVPAKAQFEPVAPRDEPPIVFYGTSIMHGACASRPGMAIPAIVGRRLGRPTINVGFSGNGTMDLSVAELLAELDAAVFAIDCLPNMDARRVRERTGPLVARLRQSRPDVPIVLVEDRRNTNSWLHPARKAHHDANHAALRAEFDKLIAAGAKRLFYLPGDALLGDDAEGATDGSHPNDLGMMRYADAYLPVLEQALAARDA